MSAGGGGRRPDKTGGGSKGNWPRSGGGGSSGMWRGGSGGGGNGNGMGGGVNGGGGSRGYGNSSSFGGGGSTNGGGSNRGSGGAPAGNICFDFQRTGSCRLGSSCRFLHSMAGSGSRSIGGGSKSTNNAKGNVCFDFMNGGGCRFGNNCKFLHSSAGGSGRAGNSGNNFSSSGSNQTKRNLDDSHRLIKQLKNTQQNQLVDAIAKSGDLWIKCWECAASSFSSDDIEVLLHTFAKIPFSAETTVTPPPIYAFEGTCRKFLKSSGTKGAKEALLAAETTLNVVRKLLSFEWDDKTIVKNALSDILEDAAGHLQRRNADHRDAISRIDKLLDSLEKPWTVKEKVRFATHVENLTDGNDIVEGSGDLVPYHHYSNWRNATVKWLLYSPTFSPSSNPRMQGPSSKSQGVYKSREQYFDTLQRLMIAMAFSEGHAALAPKCWERSGGGQCCGAALVKVSDHEESDFGKGGEKKGGHVICRGRNCNNSPTYVCKFSTHGRGLCYSCAARETEQLLGSTGSTHVYNGHVGRVDASGKLYIHSFDSRKPPMDESGTSKRQIHWRSTKRLAVPNLVGVIRLGDSTSVPANAAGKPELYRALRQDDMIYWGEVCPHGNQAFEAQQRQQGNICVNLASRAMFHPDECPDVEHEFKENDVVAIIDCQSFVPEYIPVIRALEQQEQDLLPFDDGVMLNLNANRKADLTNTVLGADAQNKAAAEGEFQRCILQQFGYQDDSLGGDDNDQASTCVVKTVTKLPLPLIEKLVSDMISSSTILPLREIRQNQILASRMHAELVKLMEKATLDFGQLVNFIDSLRNPVHVTQGPPGTGKSYLGVQLVHALAIIRKYWMQQNNSVGSPPILVLSYKNHATDEFLVDLLKSMGPALCGGNRFGRFGGGYCQLVRMGNPGDPSLTPYSERALAHRADPNVAIKEREVLNLQDLRRACQRAQRSASLFQSYQSDMFDTNNVSTLDAEKVSKQQSASAYEATEVLYAAIVRSHYIRSLYLGTDGTADDMLQSLLSIGNVLNADKVDDTKKFRLLQNKGHALGKGVIKSSLSDLFEGIKHYIASDQVYDDPYELLYMFLMGQRPKPCCEYKELDEYGEVVYQCDSISDWYEVPICYDHRCDYPKCTNSVSKSGCMFCKGHLCCYDGCDQPRLHTRVPDGNSTLVNELFCASHVCFYCVSIGQVPALEALDEPPRNVCENHQLCSVMDCLSLARTGEDYCDEHQLSKCKLCDNWAIARDLPYCMAHEFEMEQKKSILVQPSITPVDSRRTSRRQCKGENKKKKRCKSTAVAGSDFCEAHMPKDSSFKAQQKAREEELKRIDEDRSMQNKVDVGVGEPDSSKGKVMNTISDHSIKSLVGGESQGEVEDAIEDEEYGPPPDIDHVDLGRYENADEINEGDAAQHIREIFEIESGDEGESEDEFHECEQVGDTFYECQDTPIASGIGASLVDPKDWSWSLSLDDRWAACQAFMHHQCEELERIQDLVKRELPLARKRMHEAENRAKARVFENKTVIGGTIVGCIARLEQIRATRPFAVIVEEASEVMEPLLFACLSQSTVKFQMIGDHLQLQPSLMDKFDFTRINRVNVSMFERLICAPDDHRVPSGVLSVQRRMRKDICDLTREYYTDIVAIEDHPICMTKVLQGNDAGSTFWQGREVPGVRSHLFLWTHSGAQGRADVGVSKQNKEEAQMCVNLAYYLVKCGVAKASIAILTPYKGQLMLIRKLLLSDQSKARLLTHDSSNQDQVRLSTVDRFQGDEADIVIASLVVDENSRTQFVKLQNRMIVLLSRARLGCFILGNVGYFQGNRKSGGKDAKHWMRTFEILEKQPESSDNSESSITVDSSLVPAGMLGSDSLQQHVSNPSTVSIPLANALFSESRVGPTFPLCCPQHPLLSSFGASTAKDLELGFCQIICEQKLHCSHTCGLKCHWPKKMHNKNCQVQVDSPCSKHPSKLQCVNVFKNSTASRLDSIEMAVLNYKCPTKVIVSLPCGHEENLPCWQEDDIAQSKTSYPTCDRKALSPYVFPDCGHELEVACSQLELYLKDPSSVKQCSELVEYYPSDCTHSKIIKCYLEKAYRTGQRRYVCPEKVNVALPRCGHEVLVTCEKNSQLAQYALAPSECKAELGIVREGITYGEEDHKCNEPSKFIRRCGHEESVACNKAFQISKTNQLAPCLIRLPVVHPHCGHVCEVTCSDAASLKAIERLTHKPVDEVLDDDPPFPQNIPRGVGRCTAKVRLLRSCGHIEEVSCGAARGTKSRCKVSIDITSPLCGHSITVPCWRRNIIQAWRPWSDDVEESLANKSVLPSNAKLRSENLVLPDKEILDILKTCSRVVEVSKCCGHKYNERCRELVTIVSDGGKSKKGTGCSEEVTRELPDCGHKVTVQCKIWQKFTQGSAHIPCNELVEHSCWNAKLCKSDVICVPCSESGEDVAYCCDQKVDWTCPAGLHTHQLQLCVKGLPMVCPECESNEIASNLIKKESSTASLSLPHVSKGGAIFKKVQGVFPLDECLRCISSKHKINGKGQTERFFSALASTLGKFQSFQRKTKDPFQRPQYQPRLVPMFYVIPHQKKQKDSNLIQQEGFVNIKHFIKGETLNGIAIHHFSRENMLSLATDTKGSTKKTLLVGYLFCVNPKVECNKMPTGKTKMNVVKQWLDGDGHDCIEFNPSKGKLVKPLVVWDPAPLYALYSVGPLDADDISRLADEIDSVDLSTQALGDNLISSIFSGPGNGSQRAVLGKRRPKSSSETSSSTPTEANNSKPSKDNNCGALSLQGSWAESLLFTCFSSTESTDSKSVLRLHTYSSTRTECTIPQSIEHDLVQKMLFLNKGCENVYGGKKALEQKIKQSEKQWAKKQEAQPLVTPYQLLLALEIAALDDHDRAMKELEKYCAALRMTSTPAHPLLLLAFSRIGVPAFPSAPKCSGIKSDQVLSDFARISPPDMVQMLLTEDEKEILDQLARKHAPTDLSEKTNFVEVSLPASPSDIWESMKDTDGLASRAMEELLTMTGLRKVKQTAVELFKQGLVLSRMDKETRKLNAPALNYVFYGNPGTGKTTAARLFAEILFDAGLRKNNNFQECSGQGLKDAGIDDFKKKAASAMDGVLFMDEAYTLDPVGDKFKGAPIANEMLTLAENERDRLTFILAGYEDEMNDKLFAFNPGFKSRFIEVYFEDFDEEELLSVWNVQREKKKWHESNDGLGRVVVRRLMKMKGRKGFGNARAVRQKLEEACARAMAREDFDSTNLELQMEDAVGENPVNNSKLKAVLKDMERMTGWKAVKGRINDLIKLCGQNYERELKGQEALPIFLNRMFLGNPGTGKTTCAKVYGRVLKELGFLSNGEVVFKTAGDLGGQVVGESKQKTLSLIEGCRGKVLVIDEAYGLNDNLYGKQALDALVEKVQGTEADDIAVLLLGYEEQMLEMLDKQNPGLRRRFAPDQAFYFEDYTNSQLNDILTRYCKEKQYSPTLEFRERALQKLEMQRRSESHFGNAGSVQNLLKEAVVLASKRPCLDGVLRLEAEDVELPGDSDVDDPFADFDKLYGMDRIKSQLVKLKSQFDLADEEGDDRPKLGHFVFTGAPGTGKTTVARSMGKMLFRCGLISRPNVIATSGLNLTGEYVGSTKKVVQDQLDKANGGILFIDEAYELGKGQFGSEACSTLVEAMTNDEKYGGVVIIMAGYQADMQSMLDTNQGLKSRFNRFIEFPDWEVTDCIDYFNAMINERNLTLQSYEQSINLLQKGFSKLKPLKGWGNARDVVKLFQIVLENRAMRLSQECSENDDEVMEKVITESDVSVSIKAMVDARMGSSGTKRQDDPNNDPFAELDKLYRMEEVKNKLQQLQNTYLVAQNDGEDPPPLGHFIFVGSPGTGKTTVARAMSKILFDLDLTARNHVEETTGLEMQGQYTGQTKKVVESLLDKAKGGVLFIDEAYTLGQGTFGSEACDTLVAAMTNPEYAGVVVVIAGYPKDIDDMLCSNAGLKSRFTHTMVFPDWDPRDCVECFVNRANSAGYALPEKVSSILQSGFGKLKSLVGFGNARDVDATWKAATRHRADRIMLMGNLKESKKSFDERDLKKALNDLIHGRSAADGKESLRKRDVLPGPLHEPSPFRTEKDPINRETNLDAEWQDEWAGDWADDELVDFGERNAESSGEQGGDQHDCTTDARDPGVSDAVWIELQQVREYEQKYAEQCLAEEEERKRVEAELEAQLRAKQLAEKAYRKKMEELQRQRELAAEEARKKELIKEKLRAIGKCPAGFVWHQVGGGWRCGGGSHYVSDSELKRSFSYDV